MRPSWIEVIKLTRELWTKCYRIHYHHLVCLSGILARPWKVVCLQMAEHASLAPGSAPHSALCTDQARAAAHSGPLAMTRHTQISEQRQETVDLLHSSRCMSG